MIVEGSETAEMIDLLHGRTSKQFNDEEGIEGRKVWFQCWDTLLTHQRSYLARLNYVHQNAVHHGVVKVASDYPWCSAAWFERCASRSFVNSVYRFKIDSVNVLDPFEVEIE